MALVVAVLGVLVSPVVSGLVYLDATRIGLSRSRRLTWTIAVGAGSFGGFLVPVLSGGALARAYLVWVKSAPVVTSPREILALYVAVGLAISAIALAVYGVGRRSPVRR